MATRKKVNRSTSVKSKKVLSTKRGQSKNKVANKRRTKTSKSSTQRRSQKIVESWPLQRNVLFRPDRMQYIRKMIKVDGCVFCKSATSSESIDTLCVYKSKYSQVVLNKFPYNTGHVLVLPLRHTGDILHLTDDEYLDLQLTLKKAIEAIQTVYQPNAFNIGMNHGIGGGAGIPDHLHYHIVPRWHGDLNFFPLIAETKVVVETLAESYLKISDYFAQNKGGL